MRRRNLVGFLASIAAALLVGRWVTGLLADRAFFAALGIEELWWSRTSFEWTLALLAFVSAGAFAFFNLFAVRRSIVSLVLPRQLLNVEFGEAVPTQRLTLLALALAVLIGGVFAFLPHDWSLAALAWDRVAFREIDPYLERDLAFYVIQLPWERAVLGRTILGFTVVSLLVVLFYWSTPSVKWSETGLYVSTWVRRHLAVLTSLAILLVGWDWRLDRYALLADGSGIWGDRAWESAFAAYDHRIALPYLAIASFATIPIAAVFLWAAWRDLRRLAFALLTALILFGPVATTLLPILARGELTSTNARLRERPYLNARALYTRRAFGVDDVARGDSVRRARIELRALDRRVPLWDPAAAIATAPNAGSLDLFWSATAAGLEFVTARHDFAGDSTGVPWVTTRYSASRTDERGEPLLALGAIATDLPRPIVAPGAGEVLLVADSTNQIAAPPFESTLDRLVAAWSQQSPRLLLDDAPLPRPRIITHRDLVERLQEIAPFFRVGPTVTPVVRGDSLHWVVELFTTSANYPLAPRLALLGGEFNYARHAATAIVQAQTGRVVLVPSRAPDAAAASWIRRYPSLFATIETAPAWYRLERPPAVDVAVVQGTALAEVGFFGDTLPHRRMVRADDADVELAGGPPTLLQLEASGALGWSIPLEIAAGGRLLGLLVARGGEHRRTEHHDAPGPRWTSILEQLQQAADVAGFGRGSPQIRRGRVTAVPTAAGPAYVRSYFEWRSGTAPRHLGVVVWLNGVASAGESIAEALQLGPSASTALPADLLRARVAALYDEMQAALRAGDWKRYGEAWEALGRLIGRRPR